MENEEKLPELYEKFFDAKTMKEKREIIVRYKNELDDRMITNFAFSLDCVVEDGPIDQRYYSLLRCLDQMCKFETTGLR